jgi:dienelactone hydrolase
MRHTSRRGVVIGLGMLGLANCTDTRTPTEPQIAGPVSSRMEANEESRSRSPQLDTVVPSETDRGRIDDQWNAPHLVWLPGSNSNGKLMVFMGGARGTPADTKLVTEEAAKRGFHVLGLTYANSVGVGALTCGSKAELDPIGCQETLRRELLEGTRRDGKFRDGTEGSPYVTVSVGNSIDNRLRKLLKYLAKKQQKEEWSQFLNGTEPRWRRIAVAGFSLGGGQAALIAKRHEVDRVVLLAAPQDASDANGSWVRRVETDATPAERYFALVHASDPMVLATRANWIALGLDQFGPVAPAPPYGSTHRLTTNLKPQPAGGCPAPGTHRSVAEDFCTPLAADGTPALSAAWGYLMTAPTRAAGSDSDDGSASDDHGRAPPRR